MKIQRVLLLSVVFSFLIGQASPRLIAANPTARDDWCDVDEDSFCFIPFGADCDDNDSLTYPGAAELADLKDNNCTGFGDEPPVGFTRQGYSGQGFASAVTWYGDYVYVAASAVLQVYHAPLGSDPVLVSEIEFRDWVRELVVDGDTLFVAARGDGLFAYDLAGDPSHPLFAGKISGTFDVGEYTGVEATINGVYARKGLVVVALGNDVSKSQGGVDAVVYTYDPALDTFSLVKAIGTEARSITTAEVPITASLSEDGSGVYIGYGVLAGELAYVPLAVPSDPTLNKNIGGVMDIETKGNYAFVGITRVDWPWVAVSMLSRVSIVGGELVEEPLITNPGASAGNAVDIHGDLLCFGTWSPGRYETGEYNLWTFTNLEAIRPTRAAAAGTLDWIFQVSCREEDDTNSWVYVADEWGGLEIWQRSGITLTLDLDHDRAATGMFALGMVVDGSTVYSVREGGGLWAFDESDPHGEIPVVEWIDRSDPGCSCTDCCPPAEGQWPWPPAVFVSSATLNQGRILLLAQDRNNAVPGQNYLMLFEKNEISGEYDNLYSEPLQQPSWWSWSMIKSVTDEIVLASTSTHLLRAYQHCAADAADPVRFLGEIPMPTQEQYLEINDVAVYGDYLFVAEVHKGLLSDPDTGQIHVYRWKQGALVTCPGKPTLLNPPEYLGAFAADQIPHALLVDNIHNRLIVGSSAYNALPIKDGALLFYDLSSFDPVNPAELDNHRIDVSPDEGLRVARTNVFDLLLDGDNLFVVDFDNGLYLYSMDREAYTGFYPDQRGTSQEAYSPYLVQSPEGVMPLYHPIAVALTPSGRIMVQEHMSGRVSILSMASQWLYLPLVGK